MQASNHFFMDESISRTTPRPGQRLPGEGSSAMSTRSDMIMDAWGCSPPNSGQGRVF